MWSLIDEIIRERAAALPEDRRRRVLTVLTWLANLAHIRWWTWLLTFGPPLAFALHGYFAYSGLQRRLAEWQIQNWDAYYPTLTATFVAWAATSIWGLPILFVALERLARQPAPAISGDAAAVEDARQEGADDGILGRRIALVVAVVVGGVPLVVGGVKWIGAARAGPLAEVDAGQLERGEAPPGSYLRLLGRPLYDRAVGTKQRGTKEWEMTTYLPIVSTEWIPGQPIAAVVVAPSWKLEPTMGELDPKGMIDDAGLELASTLFGQDRVKLAPRVWVLELGKTPDRKLFEAKVLFGMSLPLALGAWFIVRRRVSQARATRSA